MSRWDKCAYGRPRSRYRRAVGSRYEPLFEQLRQDSQPERPVPEVAREYAEKVRLHAYRVTDGDVGALVDAGLSEDEVFELTVSIAVAAGLERWQTGARVLP
jgi:alkylhydroperoxidase family enzyme